MLSDPRQLISNNDDIFFKNDYLDTNKQGAFNKFSQHESSKKVKPDGEEEDIEINYFKFEGEGLSRSQKVNSELENSVLTEL